MAMVVIKQIKQIKAMVGHPPGVLVEVVELNGKRSVRLRLRGYEDGYGCFTPERARKLASLLNMAADEAEKARFG